MWWDTDLRAGEQFRDEIARELSIARCVIVLWCELSVHSSFVRDEASRALNANALIPVLWSDVAQPIGFGETQAIHLVGWTGEPCVDVERLVDAVTTKIGSPGESSALSIASASIGGRTTASSSEVADPFGKAVERMRRVVAGHAADDRQATGFEGFDMAFDGLPRGGLTLLTARPGVGQTALVCGIIRNWLCDAQTPAPRIGIICKTRAPDDWALRLLSGMTQIDLYRVRRGKLSAAEFEQTEAAAERLRTADIQFRDASSLPLDRIQTAVDALQDLDVLFVDLADDGSGSRETIGPVTASLRKLAERRKWACVALVTLIRDSSQDTVDWGYEHSAKPSVMDIAMLGHADQNCDLLLLLHREAYYLERSEPRMGTDEHIVWMRQLDECRGLGELEIAKNRHGPLGKLSLAYDPGLAIFNSLHARQ